MSGLKLRARLAVSLCLPSCLLSPFSFQDWSRPVVGWLEECTGGVTPSLLILLLSLPTATFLWVQGQKASYSHQTPPNTSSPHTVYSQQSLNTLILV